MTQAEVETLLPVITPFAVPASMTTLYAIAYAQFAQDAASCLGTTMENEAITYYIASMLSSGAGTGGVKSEKIDDYQITFGEGGQTQGYRDRYQQIVDQCNYIATVTSVTTEQTRDDSLEILNLDAVGVLTDDGDDEFL